MFCIWKEKKDKVIFIGIKRGYCYKQKEGRKKHIYRKILENDRFICIIYKYIKSWFEILFLFKTFKISIFEKFFLDFFWTESNRIENGHKRVVFGTRKEEGEREWIAKNRNWYWAKKIVLLIDTKSEYKSGGSQQTIESTPFESIA